GGGVDVVFGVVSNSVREKPGGTKRVVGGESNQAVISGGVVVFGVISNSAGEKPGGTKGVVGRESRGVDGGATWYFASMKEMASAVCFLENQDVRQQPMKGQTPLVLLRSTYPSLSKLKGSRLSGLVKLSAMLSYEETLLYDGVLTKVNGSFVVTWYENVIQFDVIVYKGLFHPQRLLACLACGYVFCFRGRDG
ncbi:hypothetical protein Tco_1396944, partial [Tanacetum coccineum]